MPQAYRRESRRHPGFFLSLRSAHWKTSFISGLRFDLRIPTTKFTAGHELRTACLIAGQAFQYVTRVCFYVDSGQLSKVCEVIRTGELLHHFPRLEVIAINDQPFGRRSALFTAVERAAIIRDNIQRWLTTGRIS